MSLLGLDIGTTGSKCVAFDPEGKILASAYREYPLYHPRPGWAELDADDVWPAAEAVLAEVASKLDKDPPKALAISSQGEAGVLIDKKGNKLFRSPISFDLRTAEQAAELEAKVDKMRAFEITGHIINTVHTIVKLMWMNENHPEVMEKTWKFLCFQDYAGYRLCGATAIDWSVCGRTMLFDVRKHDWSDEMLQLGGIPREILADPVPGGTRIGEIPKEASRRLGLPAGMPVVAGAHDQPAGALGAGIIEPEIAMDSTGTVECITASLAEAVINAKMLESSLACYSHAASDLYVTVAYNFTGGSLLRWYRDQLGGSEVAEAERRGCDPYEVMMEMAASVKGPSRPLVLPHFTSTGTPWFDDRAKGVIAGLTLDVTRAEIIKALLEGVTFEMRLNLGNMDAAGVRVRELRGIGGGAKSPVWLQIKADIYNRPVLGLDVSEAACLGVAMLAGVAAGEYKDLREAVKAAVKIRRTYEPDPARARQYEERFGLYEELYPTFKGLAHRM